MIQTDLKRLADDAMRAHRAGDFESAERLCRAVLELEESYSPSLVHLSVLLRNQGRFEESSDLAQQAIQADPESADGYIQLGLSCLGSGRPAEAWSAFSEALARRPELGPVHYNAGLALENLGRRKEAKAAFLEACRLNPGDVKARLSLGSMLLAEEDVLAAMSQAETALKADPKSAEARLLKAKVFVAQGEGVKAEENIRESLQMDPAASFGHTMLGFRLLQTGQFQEAESEFRRSIELDPAQGVAFFGITQARRLDESDRPLVEEMRETLHGVPLTYEEAGYLHFGLAKALDNLGEFDTAMHHFDEAHRNHQLSQYGEKPFDADAYEREFDAIVQLYSEELVQAPTSGLDTNLPIFVVGMMRSGTTLTEQILSSHPEVSAAGEQTFWAKRGHLADDLTGGKFDAKQAVALAREYTRKLRLIAPSARRITDKLPGNYMRLGMLHRALPNAKIVHCRRSPVDTALSIYITPNPTAPAFAHSKAGIAVAYRSYLKLIDHWRSVLPPSAFHEIRYEELVAEPERVIRGMLEFLGLEWNDACLRHDQNAKEVKTPSLWQVRQPMYSSSVGRWKRYEPWLGELRELVDLR